MLGWLRMHLYACQHPASDNSQCYQTISVIGFFVQNGAEGSILAVWEAQDSSILFAYF